MIIDFVLLFILLGSSAYGYIRGFSQMLISLSAFVLTIIISLTFYGTISTKCLETNFGIKTKASVENEINNIFEEKQENAIENTPYLSSLTKVTANSEGVIDFSNLSDTLAETVTRIFLTVPAIIIIFILINGLIYVLRRFVIRLTSLPVIHGTDSVLGALCGTLFGILLIGVIFIFMVFLQFVPSLSELREQFDSSVIVLLINDFIF